MSRNINKQELICKVRELTGLTSDEKSALLKLLNEKKTYGLVWESHEEEVEEQLREQLPVLCEVARKRIISKDADSPNHIIIEAENLHALVALTYTHAGKIDVMYLDPPYNTGNKDFVYNDSYVDSEDSYRHSKWLSFMEKRLRIAKSLLSDKGVVFISIDDNEQAQLKILCDEIFSNSCFVGLISRATGTTTGQDTGSLGKACDYILVYSKYPNYQIGGIPLTDKDLSRYDMQDEKGAYSILQLRRTGGEDRREDRPTMFFPITAPDGTEVYPYGPTGYESRWRVGPERVIEMRKENLLYFKKDNHDQWKVYYKFYAEGKTKRPSNLWTELDGNKKAQIELKSVIPNAKFETPKPIQVIRRILELTSTKNSIILDFFAGSGTTLHAVMELNKDGGNRQCILVTNNENNICEEVTYERNRRVIQGYTTPKGEQVAGLTKNNLRYYKADFIPREPSSKNKRELVKAATDLLCIKENMYQEVKMECKGKALRKDYTRRFTEGCKDMIVIYEPAVIKYIVEELKTWDKKEFIKVYVFSEGRYAYDDDFKEVLDKVTLCALPDAIYQAYRRVLPRRKKAKPVEIDLSEEEQAEALAEAAQYSYNDKEGGEA